MLKQFALILLVSCLAAPTYAGLFADDDARKQIQQLEGRVLKLEERVLKLEELVAELQNLVKQQTKSMLDLHAQIEAFNGEISKLRGQSEVLAQGLQDTEKREKDFYVDLDTRLRRFELVDNAAPASDSPSPAPADPDDPALENRAFEAAYGLFKSGNHANAIKAFQEFLSKYPDSVHVANANYWLGNAQFVLKAYKNALKTYQGLLEAFPETARAADVLFNVARCQQELKQPATAQKTLKQLIAKYPTSEAAARAKKLQTISK